MLAYHISCYLKYCMDQKNLNSKTARAYQTDLKQFEAYLQKYSFSQTLQSLSREILTDYIMELHKIYKPKSVKRKLASLKAFFAYLKYEEILVINPFQKIKIKYKEPELLPRIISTYNLQKLFTELYQQKQIPKLSKFQEWISYRDIAVLELLFSTSMRISELCNLRKKNVDFKQWTLRIYGKGARERILCLTTYTVINAMTLLLMALEVPRNPALDYKLPGMLF